MSKKPRNWMKRVRKLKYRPQAMSRNTRKYVYI